MNRPRVADIFITEAGGRPMRAVESINAVANRGLEGDRYHDLAGTFSSPDRPVPASAQVTLIEREAVEAVTRDHALPLDESETRRNIVTAGVALNHLVGKRFRVGQAVFKGIKLCEPCKHLEALTREGVRAGLVHRGGLRAQIVQGGPIRVGDAIEPLRDDAREEATSCAS